MNASTNQYQYTLPKGDGTNQYHYIEPNGDGIVVVEIPDPDNYFKEHDAEAPSQEEVSNGQKNWHKAKIKILSSVRFNNSEPQ